MRTLNKGVLLLLMVLPFLFAGTSCNSSRKASDAVQRAEKLQEEKRERQAEKYEEARERHMAIQTKETKKRMEKMQRKSERYNYNKKKFFLVRWWEKIFKKRKRRETQPGGV